MLLSGGERRGAVRSVGRGGGVPRGAIGLCAAFRQGAAGQRAVGTRRILPGADRPPAALPDHPRGRAARPRARGAQRGRGLGDRGHSGPQPAYALRPFAVRARGRRIRQRDDVGDERRSTLGNRVDARRELRDLAAQGRHPCVRKAARSVLPLGVPVLPEGGTGKSLQTMQDDTAGSDGDAVVDVLVVWTPK